MPPTRSVQPLAWRLFRASHPEPVAAVTAATAALTLASGRGPRRAAAATAAVLAGQLVTGWTNDLLDVELDRAAGRLDKPLATGEVAPATVRRALLLAAPATAVLSLAAGRREAVLHGAGVAAAAAYNLGLRATVASPLPYMAAFALLPAYAKGGRVRARVTAAAALLGAGAHFGQVMPDIETDRRSGVLGLPQRLGRRGSAAAIAGLMAAAAGILGSDTTAKPARALAAGGAGVGVAAAAAGLRGAPKLSFRLTMAAAGLLVGSYAAGELRGLVESDQ